MIENAPWNKRKQSALRKLLNGVGGFGSLLNNGNSGRIAGIDEVDQEASRQQYHSLATSYKGFSGEYWGDDF